MTGVLIGKELALKLPETVRRVLGQPLLTAPGGRPKVGGDARILLAKTNEAIPVGGSGACTIQTGSDKGAETPSVDRILASVYNRFGPELELDDWCLIVRVAGSGWEIVSSPTTSSAADGCQCSVVAGVVDPIATDLFGSRAAYRWALSGIETWLTSLGFDTTDLMMVFDSAGPSWHIELIRTCGYSSDDYILMLEQDDTAGWIVSLQLDGGGAPNCTTEVDVTWKLLGRFPQPDRANILVIDDKLTKRAEHGAYVDPPTGCQYCLTPQRKTRTITCPYGDIVIPETLQLSVANDAVFANASAFAWGTGGSFNYGILNDKTAELSALWEDVSGSFLADVTANEVSPGVFDYYYDFVVPAANRVVGMTPIGSFPGTSDTLRPVTVYDSDPYHRWRLSVGCCDLPGRLRLEPRFVWSADLQSALVPQQEAIRLDGSGAGSGRPWEFLVPDTWDGSLITPTISAVSTGTCQHAAVGTRLRMVNVGPYSGGGPYSENLASGGVTVAIRIA